MNRRFRAAVTAYLRMHPCTCDTGRECEAEVWAAMSILEGDVTTMTEAATKLLGVVRRQEVAINNIESEMKNLSERSENEGG